VLDKIIFVYVGQFEVHWH